jgi:hypothetical protein
MPTNAPDKSGKAAAHDDTDRTGAAAVTINPATNDLTLNPTDVLDETITVTIPKGHKCRNVNLVPSASIAPFIDFINPPGGFNGITGEQEQTLTFRVRFHGRPCTPEPQVFTGTLDVVCDQEVIARKEVKITIPACPSRELVYSVKFVCGEQPACGCECTSVQPGRYATEINIHNYGIKEVLIRKRFIPVILAGAPAGKSPKFASVQAEDKITLPPQTATMDDCCRIAELLFKGAPASALPITIGFLEIRSNGPIAVTAVYTATGLDSSGVSIDVEQIAPHRA